MAGCSTAVGVNAAMLLLSTKLNRRVSGTLGSCYGVEDPYEDEGFGGYAEGGYKTVLPLPWMGIH
jgi:hypothetical protein